jgi:hypothetical protein
VFYTHEAIGMNINDHPLGKTLPKPTKYASIQTGPSEFRDFAARKGAPETLDGYLYEDIPQLALHITSFNDATIVALSWSHVLMDAIGQQGLLSSWSLVLAGRDSEVPAMLGAREDAVCAVADAPVEKKEDFKMKDKQLKGWSMLAFGLRFAWDLLWNQVIETRTIFLPKEVVAKLRAQAQEDLAALDGGEEKPFVSEGDVLTAWGTRAVALSLPQPRPITALHALNARYRIPALMKAPGVYIQNMAVGAFTFLPAEIVRGPLGPIAVANRQHLMEQSTEGQVLACLRQLRSEPKLTSDPAIVCGPSDALLVPFTNWTRADFYKMADFSPAVVRAGEIGESRSNPPGTMIYHHAQGMHQGPMIRNVFVITGKDHGDNYWLTGILTPQTWAVIEKDINNM